MNNKVTKAPTDRSSVKLAVYDTSGSRLDVPSEENNGDSIVWIDPSTSSPSLFFIIRLDPDTLQSMADIQYVVETAPFDDLNGGKSNSSRSSAPSHSRPSPTPTMPTVPSPPSPGTPEIVTESSFINASPGGGIQCNGRRGHVRGKIGSVNYELATKKESNKKGDSDDGSIILSEVVAGYSEYHGPVTLTPRILFKTRDVQSGSFSATAGRGEL